MPFGPLSTRWRCWLLVCCCGSAGLWGTSVSTQTFAAEPFPTIDQTADAELDSSLQGFHSHGSAGLWQPEPETEDGTQDEKPEVVEKRPAPESESEVRTAPESSAAAEPREVGSSSGRSKIALLGSEIVVDEGVTQVGHTEGPTLIQSPRGFEPVPQREREYVPDPFRMSQVPPPSPAAPPPPSAPPAAGAPVPAPKPTPEPQPLFSPEIAPEPMPYDGYIPVDEPVSPMFESVLGIDDGVHYFPNPTEVFVDGAIVEEVHDCDKLGLCDPCSPWYKLFRPFCSEKVSDYGIGQERVMYAPFYIEPALPQNFTGLRFRSGTDLYYPDRSELFWAGGGRGPALPEVEVDYSEAILTLSSGSKTFSATTEIPIRYVDPVVNANTSGLGDISIATKLVMIDGDRWTLTQYFRTIMATGSKTRGLSPGHVSLEPGFLASMRWTDRTYLFGEIRYQFPVGGNKQYAGQLLRYGLGLSTVAYETDEFAILPTFEVNGWSAQGGSKTSPLGVTLGVGGETAPIVTHGLRFVLGPAGDLGLFEFGISSSFALNNEGPFSTLGQIDMRFVY